MVMNEWFDSEMPQTGNELAYFSPEINENGV